MVKSVTDHHLPVTKYPMVGSGRKQVDPVRGPCLPIRRASETDSNGVREKVSDGLDARRLNSLKSADLLSSISIKELMIIYG